MKPRTIFRWAVFNLFVTAMIGFALRLQPLGLMAGFHHKNWLHTHSHLAFLGWIYPAIISLILSRCDRPADSYTRYLFGSMQAMVLAMLFTFPVYGYGWPSIAVLSLHLGATIWLVFYAVRHLGRRHPVAARFVRAGTWLLVISAMGALALGPVSAAGLKYTPYYFSAIYFYLHFQYNGWFTLALVGTLLSYVHTQLLSVDKQRWVTSAYWLMSWGIALTFVLSVLGYDVPQWVYAAGGLGALLQIAGFALLFFALYGLQKPFFWSLATIERRLLLFAMIFLVAKLLAQALSAVPAMANFAYRSRDLVIAYLHEYLIGSITLALLALAISKGWMNVHRSWVRGGIWVFVLGFLLTEMTLLARGMWPVLYPVGMQYVLVMGAAMMTIALLCIAGGAIVVRNAVKKIG